jgi:hypothetical protein
MPKGPKGQKRPADVVSNAVHVMRVLTGEASDGPKAAAPKPKAKKKPSAKRQANKSPTAAALGG